MLHTITLHSLKVKHCFLPTAIFSLLCLLPGICHQFLTSLILLAFTVDKIGHSCYLYCCCHANISPSLLLSPSFFGKPAVCLLFGSVVMKLYECGLIWAMFRSGGGVESVCKPPTIRTVSLCARLKLLSLSHIMIFTSYPFSHLHFSR